MSKDRRTLPELRRQLLVRRLQRQRPTTRRQTLHHLQRQRQLPPLQRLRQEVGVEDMTIYLVSFGYLHGPPPQADRVEDVRRRLHDPARAKGILDLDGFHPDVQNIVMDTPGAGTLLDNLAEYCLNATGDITVAIGCAGGRHRACALTEILAKRLESLDVDVDVDHRDAHLPRVLTSRRPA